MSDEDDVRDAFVVDVARVEGATVVSFAGELDVSVCNEMRQSLSDVAGSSNVRVNLAQVTFIDSACIGLLVAACRRVRDRDGIFAVTSPAAIVRRVFEVSGLVDYLQVEDPS
jgi:anti-anti-sigma factor